jgi:hypothetical protein
MADDKTIVKGRSSSKDGVDREMKCTYSDGRFVLWIHKPGVDNGWDIKVESERLFAALATAYVRGTAGPGF